MTSRGDGTFHGSQGTPVFVGLSTWSLALLALFYLLCLLYYRPTFMFRFRVFVRIDRYELGMEDGPRRAGAAKRTYRGPPAGRDRVRVGRIRLIAIRRSRAFLCNFIMFRLQVVPRGVQDRNVKGALSGAKGGRRRYPRASVRIRRGHHAPGATMVLGAVGRNFRFVFATAA